VPDRLTIAPETAPKAIVQQRATPRVHGHEVHGSDNVDAECKQVFQSIHLVNIRQAQQNSVRPALESDAKHRNNLINGHTELNAAPRQPAGSIDVDADVLSTNAGPLLAP